jgi:plasmid stability protein
MRQWSFQADVFVLSTCDIIDIIVGDHLMGQLIVRNVNDDLIRALKMRAAEKRRSAEAEHREILREALESRRQRHTLKQLLAEMPSVGDDADFERPRDTGRKTRL